MIYIILLIIITYSNFVSLTEIDDPTEYQKRIAWGNHVHKEGAHPYFVSLQVQYKGQYIHYCGGALIGKRIVITAANCLSNEKIAKLSHILPNYRNTLIMENNDPTFKIAKVMIHPDFIHRGKSISKHDIAVVLLDKDDNRTNATLKLPIESLTPNTKVEMLGFGRIEFNKSTDRLKDETVFIRSDDECREGLSDSVYSPEDNICVSNERGSSACKGDSGSPLVWEDPKEHENYLVGVASAGYVMCYLFDYTSYVDVYANLKFINNAINQLTGVQSRSDQTEY